MAAGICVTRAIGRISPPAQLAVWGVLALLCAALTGCAPSYETTPTSTRVTLGGRVFTLELAMDTASREKGLSGRTEIPVEGGMLFIFPDRGVRVQEFVMRDCRIDIDIIFLDRARRVTAMHAMKVEPPREATESLAEYNNRLRRYSSRFDAQYAIELRGGTLESLGLKPGQLIDLDPTLAARAR